ncbi:MAG: hypothetical protein L0221_17340 [Chloroflexi bacterium]|nr:hypothetical protein [Chloroflexota bacterium]
MSATSRVANELVPPHCFAALAALALASVLALPAPARGDAGVLDVATLRVRLKDTPAIGLVAKLRLKSEIEDLIDDLAAFHAGRADQALATLQSRYRGLVVRVVGLLERDDAPLAHDLSASTDHLWATLADPGQFASLAQS